MIRIHRSGNIRVSLGVAALAAALAGNGIAQPYPGGTTGGTTTGTTTGPTTTGPTTTGTTGTTGSTGGTTGGTSANAVSATQRLPFNRPEAWALKYFASAFVMSGLQPPEISPEGRRFGSITVGMELGWLPQLSTAQQLVGFNGTRPEDLNKAPIIARPSVRIGLPWKMTAFVAGPPPFQVFGVTPRLVDFGLERPIVDREQWIASWRGYAQAGSVTGSFTCPKSVLGFAPGSPENPTRCTGESKDEAGLGYIGTELQLGYRMGRGRKWIPHVASGFNYMDMFFQTDAPIASASGRAHTRLSTVGHTFTESAGISYLISPRLGFTVDAFYTPLSIQRTATSPQVNDGLFNVRALLSYTFR